MKTYTRIGLKRCDPKHCWCCSALRSQAQCGAKASRHKLLRPPSTAKLGCMTKACVVLLSFQPWMATEELPGNKQVQHLLCRLIGYTPKSLFSGPPDQFNECSHREFDPRMVIGKGTRVLVSSVLHDIITQMVDWNLFPRLFRAVATKKKLVRPKYEECEKKNDGKSCEARQAVRSTALLQLGVWGRCKPPSWVRGRAPEAFKNFTLSHRKVDWFWLTLAWKVPRL